MTKQTKQSKRDFLVEYHCQALCVGRLRFQAADEAEAKRIVTAKLHALDAYAVADGALIARISRMHPSSPVVPAPAGSARAGHEKVRSRRPAK